MTTTNHDPLREVYGKVVLGRVVKLQRRPPTDDLILLVVRVAHGIAYGLPLNCVDDFSGTVLTMDYTHHLAEQTKGWSILV